MHVINYELPRDINSYVHRPTNPNPISPNPYLYP